MREVCQPNVKPVFVDRSGRRRRLPKAGWPGPASRGLAYLIAFQLVLPLAAPMVDVYALYGLLLKPAAQVAAVWCGFVAVRATTAAYALRLDHERLGPLWTLPLQRLVYRQLMYLVVIQSTVTAITGIPLPWQRIARIGQAHQALQTR